LRVVATYEQIAQADIHVCDVAALLRQLGVAA
jgi:hypothetical protein